LFEINQGNPTKYCLALKEQKFNIQQQIFRKAFYENSQTFQDSLIFAEISSQRLGRKVGLNSPDDIVFLHNKNPYDTLPVEEKLLNLSLERTDPLPFLKQADITARFKDFQSDFSE
jgi:hypothetical protein